MGPWAARAATEAVSQPSELRILTRVGPEPLAAAETTRGAGRG
jgi:hypothetical protein